MYDAGGKKKKPGEYGNYWAGCRPVPARCLSFLGNTSPSRLRETRVEGLMQSQHQGTQALRCAHGEDAK